jgi:hypothetical protein
LKVPSWLPRSSEISFMMSARPFAATRVLDCAAMQDQLFSELVSAVEPVKRGGPCD